MASQLPPPALVCDLKFPVLCGLEFLGDLAWAAELITLYISFGFLVPIFLFRIFVIFKLFLIFLFAPPCFPPCPEESPAALTALWWSARLRTPGSCRATNSSKQRDAYTQTVL